MALLNTILSPPILVNNISIIASILGGMTLFFFGSLFDKQIIFPSTKWLDNKVYELLRQNVNRKLKAKHCAHISESAATIFLIAYCYLNVTILAVYIYQPILQGVKNMLLLVCMALFIAISWAYHHYQLHRKW